MNKAYLYIVMLSVFGLPLASPAFAGELRGYGELRYAQHTAEVDGSEVLDASHFVQKYSLLWSQSGMFRGGRLGEYDVSLGYEWSWVDSEINGSEISVDNPLDKVLFSGDVLLAPGGLPLRMHLYSYDLDSTNFTYQELGELFRDENYDPQRGIITSLSNGTHVTTGMTLVAGAQNGNYRGQYRDLLTALPRLFIDFRQDEVKDIKGPTPREYTDRDLAFVSLNKNKNWFHYRFFTHDDKLDSINDYRTQSFLIGTIDHTNRRQWVDLTNWIQVSTDISYSEKIPDSDANDDRQERYDYNLFATAQRADWRGGTYMSFSRVRDDRSLQKVIDVPILANGRLNRDTTWRIRLENQHEEHDLFVNETERSRNSIFLASRLDMFSQSKYIVSPVLDLEYLDGWSGDGTAMRVGVEAYSNQRYRSVTDMFGSYTMSVFDGTSGDGDNTSYWEHQLMGRFSRSLRSDVQTSFSQDLTVGFGKYGSGTSNFIKADASILSLQDRADVVSDDTYYRSITSWNIDHKPASRIYNRFELSYDYIKSSVDSGGQFIALHNLNYYGRKVTASMDNELIVGNRLHDVDTLGSSPTGLGLQGGGTVSSSFESRSRVSYDPFRMHHFDMEADLEWRDFESGGSDHRYTVSQLYEYTLWKDSGLLRKTAVLGEELEYEDYTPTVGESTRLLSFTLFSELYPTRQTLLGVRMRYEIDVEEETDTALVFLTAGIDFEKFQMQFDYAYGTRTAGITEPERVEHKWEVKVKKIF